MSQAADGVVSSELLNALAATASPSTKVAKNSRPSPIPSGKRLDVADWITRYKLDARGPEPWKDGQRWIFPVCPWNSDHSNGSAFIMQFPNGAISAGCHHNGCKGKDWHSLRDHLEPGWRDKPKTGHTRPTTTGGQPTHQNPFTPFPIAALPEPIRSFVAVASCAIGCDASFVALPVLVMLAGCVGNSRGVILKRGWVELPILWGAIVGESGTLKSPAFRLVLKAIRKAQQKSLKEHEAVMVQHAAALQRYKLALAAWKDDGSGDPPVEPEEPKARRMIVSDTTVEAIAQILLANPRGLLCARDELAGWVGSFDRYSGGRGSDVSAWLSMHDGEAVIVDRKTGPQRTISIPSAALSVIGGIQPGILARSFSQEHRDAGLLARLLLAMPPTKPALWTDIEIPESHERALALTVDGLLALVPEVDTEGNPTPRCIPLSLRAKELWVAWHDTHARELANTTGDLAAAFSKLKGTAARLALGVYLIRRINSDPTLLPGPEMIDGESMRMATTLTDWFKREASRVYACLSESDDDRERRRLVEWVERQDGPVTVRDLTRGPQQFRGEPEAAELALRELVEMGLGEWIDKPPGPQGGQPTTAFKLSYRGDGDGTPKAPEKIEESSPSPMESVVDVASTATTSIPPYILQQLQDEGHSQQAALVTTPPEASIADPGTTLPAGGDTVPEPTVSDDPPPTPSAPADDDASDNFGEEVVKL